MNRSFSVLVVWCLSFSCIQQSNNTPDDPAWPKQNHLLANLHVQEAWTISNPQHKVIVAVIDYGCNLHLKDIRFLNQGIQLGSKSAAYPYFLVNQDHGTQVASIIAATKNNGLGMAGIAENVFILPIALVTSSDKEVAEGILYAVDHKADIINMSIGTYSWDTSVLNEAIEYAHKKGVVLVAAAGNDGLKNSMTMPAKHPLIMAVGGSDNDEHNFLINYGDLLYHRKTTGISVVAPSVNIPSLDFNGWETTLNGSSAACALVTGVVSILKSNYPQLTNIEIRNAIESSTDKVGGHYTLKPEFPNGTRCSAMGYGRVNAYRALLKAKKMADVN